MWVQSLGQEDPLEGGDDCPLQCSCLENPHGQRRLAYYSPWGQKELDRSEQHTHTHTHTHTRSLILE